MVPCGILYIGNRSTLRYSQGECSMESYTFRQCTVTLLDDLFGLRKVFSNQSLMSWLQTEVPLSTREHETLRDFQELLILNSDAWNEQELSLNFIGPVFALGTLLGPLSIQPFLGAKDWRCHSKRRR